MAESITPRLLGLSAFARLLEISENTARRYSNVGIVNPKRDSSGRRLFTPADVDKARAYLERKSQ